MVFTTASWYFCIACQSDPQEISFRVSLLALVNNILNYYVQYWLCYYLLLIILILLLLQFIIAHKILLSAQQSYIITRGVGKFIEYQNHVIDIVVCVIVHICVCMSVCLCVRLSCPCLSVGQPQFIRVPLKLCALF